MFITAIGTKDIKEYKFKESLKKDELELIQKKDHLQIHYRDEILEYHPGIIINKRILLPVKENFLYIYSISDEFIFTRSFFQDANISKQHFKITKGFLEDLNSLNGTYINNQKVGKCRLRNGDIIQVYKIRLLYFDGFLFSNEELNLPQYRPYLQPENVCKDSWVLDSFILQKETHSLQTYQAPALYKPPKLFQTIGSSAMIGLSSFVCALVTYLIDPMQSERVFNLLLTSTAMSSAFLFYGLINRRMQMKQSDQDRNESRQMYLDYLESFRLHILEKYENIQESFLKEKQEYLKGKSSLLFRYSSFWKVYCGVKDSSWIDIQKPVIRYDQKDSFWNQAMEKMIQEIPLFIQENVWILPGKNIWVKGNEPGNYFSSLFERVCLSCSNTDIKILWIDEEKNNKSFVWHPMAVSKKEAVVYGKNHCVLCFATSLDQLLFLDNIPNKSIIYYSCNTTDYDFDEIIYDDQNWTPCLSSLLRNAYPYGKTDTFSNWEIMYPNLFACKDIQDYRDQKSSTCFTAGIDQKRKFIQIDLSQYQHGPHMLVAGTTGSGKSEFITSMLLQLAANNSSQQTSFILIDFKAGIMSQQFSRFPHFAGQVTSMNAAEMYRFQKCMEREIEKRTEKLSKMLEKYPEAAGDVENWNARYPNDPISHLYIVVDEFAQLKTKMPESMSFIKELARIGRSLGFHLILATQKPGGIVDEQIWSNSRMKVCFKVNTVYDSREMLNNDKAAFCTNAGEGYIQIGNQEEEYNFQSLYSKEPLFLSGSSRWKELDANGNVKSISSVQSISAFQKLSILINNHPLSSLKILPAFSIENLQNIRALLAADNPSQQSIEKIDITLKKPVVFLGRNKEQLYKYISMAACHYSHTDHYVFDPSNYQSQLPKLLKGEIWKLCYTDKIVGIHCVIENRDEIDWIERFISLKNVLLFIWTANPALSFSNNLRKVVLPGWNKEDVQMFFQHFLSSRFKRNGFCLYKDDRLTEEALWLAEEKNRVFNSQVTLTQKELFIGIDSKGTMYSIDSKKGLIILYESLDQTNSIQTLLDMWIDINPLIQKDLLDNTGNIKLICLEQLNLKDKSQIKTQLHEQDVLYLGDNYSKNCHLLSLPTAFNPQSNQIFIHNQSIQYLEIYDQYFQDFY